MTALWDAKLDPVTHDIVIEGGDIVLISGPEEITQAVKIALLIVATEWFLDDTVGWITFDGMPFGKGGSLNAIRRRIVEVIQGVSGILSDPPVEITEASVTGRTLKVSYRAHCATGVIADTVEVSP